MSEVNSDGAPPSPPNIPEATSSGDATENLPPVVAPPHFGWRINPISDPSLIRNANERNIDSSQVSPPKSLLEALKKAEEAMESEK